MQFVWAIAFNRKALLEPPIYSCSVTRASPYDIKV